MSKPIFGIISWFPDKKPDRQMRIDRFNRLLNQLSSYWSNVPILVVAQNWKDYRIPANIKSRMIIKRFYTGLGILEARKTLRREFLKLNYDYAILFDDDAIIEKCTKDGAELFMKTVKEHTGGFSFLQYEASQLNGCVISKEIFEKEDFPNIDPQKCDGFEDRTYSWMLHVKYSDVEFDTNKFIRCVHYLNPTEKAPSTWRTDDKLGGFTRLCSNTNTIIDYINKNKDFPQIDVFIKYGELIPNTMTVEEYEHDIVIEKIRRIVNNIKDGPSKEVYKKALCSANHIDVDEI